MQVNLADRGISAGSLQDSWRETGISATKILVSEPTKIPTGFSAGSRTPAAKISAGVRAKFSAGILRAKRNPGGQNLGGIPVVIPPRSRRDSRRGAKTRRPKSRRAIPPVLSARSEIPAAKISAGSRW